MSHIVDKYKDLKDAGRAPTINDNGDGSYTVSLVLKDPHTGLDNGTESVTITVAYLNTLKTKKDDSISNLNNDKVNIDDLLTDIASL